MGRASQWWRAVGGACGGGWGCRPAAAAVCAVCRPPPCNAVRCGAGAGAGRAIVCAGCAGQKGTPAAGSVGQSPCLAHCCCVLLTLLGVGWPAQRLLPLRSRVQVQRKHQSHYKVLAEELNGRHEEGGCNIDMRWGRRKKGRGIGRRGQVRGQVRGLEGSGVAEARGGASQA